MTPESRRNETVNPISIANFCFLRQWHRPNNKHYLTGRSKRRLKRLGHVPGRLKGSQKWRCTGLHTEKEAVEGPRRHGDGLSRRNSRSWNSHGGETQAAAKDRTAWRQRVEALEYFEMSLNALPAPCSFFLKVKFLILLLEHARVWVSTSITSIWVRLATVSVFFVVLLHNHLLKQIFEHTLSNIFMGFDPYR